MAQFRKAGHENRPLRNTHTHGRDWKNVLLVGSVDGGAMAFTYARLRRQHQPYTHTVPGGFSCFTDREKTLRTRTVWESGGKRHRTGALPLPFPVESMNLATSAIRQHQSTCVSECCLVVMGATFFSRSREPSEAREVHS